MVWIIMFALVVVVARCIVLELRTQAQDKQINWMAERIANQSDALSQNAEKARAVMKTMGVR